MEVNSNASLVLSELSKISVHLKYCVTYSNEVLNLVESSYSESDLCVTQVIPASLVIDEQQLKLPAIYVIEAFITKNNISDKPHIEYLLYFMGTRQIKEALNKLRKFMREPYILLRFCLNKEVEVEDLKKSFACFDKRISELNLIDEDALTEIYGISKSPIQKMLKDVLTRITYFKITATKKT